MSETKRVVVTGATGLIGKRLCARLRERGYAVVVFSRNPDTARRAVPGAVDYVAWQPAETGPWAATIDGAYGIVNLAGASIAGWRWTEGYKRKLRDSRVIGTRGLVNAVEQAVARPHVLVNPSGVNYYGFRDDTRLDESAPPGDDFMARLCLDWEQAADRATDLGVRVVVVRTGLVLDDKEGALPRLMLPFKLFVGGPILPGTQWLSWIHRDDQVNILVQALEDARMSGPINATAPHPQTNRDFAATLGKVMRRPSWMPVPGFALKLLLGEMAEALLINGQRVIPARLQELGYQFKYPTSEEALRQILRGEDR